MPEGDGVTRDPDEQLKRQIDATQLAALVDGRLSPSERAALLDQLDRSDDALDVLVDAAAVSAELSSTPSVQSLGQSAPRRRRGWVLAGLAAAAVIAGILVAPRAASLLRNANANANSTEFLAGVAVPSAVVAMAMDTRPWSEVRGGTLPEERTQAIRAGATLADLGLALQSKGDSAIRVAAIRRAMDDLIAVLDGASAGSASAQTFRAMRNESFEAMSAQFAAARDEAIAIDPDYVTLGAWAEAARLAALAHNGSFFAKRQTIPLLEQAAAYPELDATGQGMLRRIRQLLPPTDAMGWTRLAATLRELLSHLGG